MIPRSLIPAFALVLALTNLTLSTRAEPEVTSRALYGITITHVEYRVVADHSKSIDVTDFVNKIFESGAKSLRLTTREAADSKAPDPIEKKEFVFTYTYAGQHKEKVFAEAATLHFQKDLK